MIRGFILAALLMVSPLVSSGDNCCVAYPLLDQMGYQTGYMYIVNHSPHWVDCWMETPTSYFQFQIPPSSRSRSYPANSFWGCG